MDNLGQNRMNYKQLQENMPDYIFGRLNEADSLKFEESVSEYPDLVQEISEVRTVFALTEKIDFDKFISSRTKNLSVKVNSRLKKQVKSRKTFGLQYLAPATLAIVLIFFYVTKTNKLKPDNLVNEKNVSTKTEGGLNKIQQDKMKNLANAGDFFETNIIDQRNEKVRKPKPASLDDLKNLNDYDISFLNDYISDDIINNVNNPYDLNAGKDSYHELLEMTDEINDQDLNTILKELENADV